jgi:CRISPR-associated endonuclease Csn1
VHATSGSVTDKLRDVWGWDEILMRLRIPEFRKEGMTEWIELKTNGQVHKKEVIKGWTKRDDNRHHAIDALAIACTKPAFIQRINRLNSETVRNEIYEEIKGRETKERLSLLDNYLVSQKPFDTAQVERHASGILISYKSGKKVATKGQRVAKKDGKKVVVQKGIIVPRGPLSEAYIYGKIKARKREVLSKRLFQAPDLIDKDHIRQAIFERLSQYGNDPGKAFKSCKKDPILIGKDHIELNFASIFIDKYVIKYPLSDMMLRDVESIVDKRIRELVKARFEIDGTGGPLKDLKQNPIYYDKFKKLQIRTVRRYITNTELEPVHDNTGFVITGNNHHISIYSDPNGKYQEHVVNFWHAVDRVRFDLPVIIKSPKETWDKIISSGRDLPEIFLSKLPNPEWTFVTSMQQNEMFVLGMGTDEFEACLTNGRQSEISRYLYRVQSLSESDYQFTHHLYVRGAEKSSNTKNKSLSIKLGSIYRIRGANSFINLEPIKVKVNLLGQVRSIEW